MLVLVFCDIFVPLHVRSDGSICGKRPSAFLMLAFVFLTHCVPSSSLLRSCRSRDRSPAALIFISGIVDGRVPFHVTSLFHVTP